MKDRGLGWWTVARHVKEITPFMLSRFCRSDCQVGGSHGRVRLVDSINHHVLTRPSIQINLTPDSL